MSVTLRPAAIAVCLSLTGAALIMGDCAAVNAKRPDPAATPASGYLTDASGLFSDRFGRLEFVARDGNRLAAEVYRSTVFEERDGPVWFVMHGASRDADRYIRIAAPVAERYGALAVAIYFPKYYYPRSRDYTLGVLKTGRPDGKALAQGRWRDSEDYLYAEIERVFDAIRLVLNGNQPGYYLFGHSAGAQFTHRLLTFLPDARVLTAVAANAGWYTLPVNKPVPEFTMPYGLYGSPLGEDGVRRLLSAKLAVLVGDRDTRTPDEDRQVRGSSEAMQQGVNRYERGLNYFATGSTLAEGVANDFGWRVAIVPRAKHSARQVISSAGFFLFEPEPVACKPSDAADAKGLVITEILIDPPDSLAGDANADGERDPQADEFLEFVNTGDEPICLSGWALGDSRKRERHVFPLGRALGPGQALVVFGGGTPTGSFGASVVQWAAFDGKLSLTNAGDHLTLEDTNGDVAFRVSWGDCGGIDCADDHIPLDDDPPGSMIRTSAGWQPHARASQRKFSPGTRTDGTAWR